MKGKVEDGALVTLGPCHPHQLQIGDVVLVRVNGAVYLHLIKARQGDRFLIGNNRGGTNGWVGPEAIYGLAIMVNNPKSELGRKRRRRRPNTRCNT